VYNIAVHYVSIVGDTVLRVVVNDFYVKVGDSSFWEWALFRHLRKIAKNEY